MSPLTAAGRAALNELITLQSTIIAYIDDFKLLMIMSLAVIPLVLLLRKPKVAPVMDHSAVME
jgi:DHA2 family multidrug resistance protein